MEDNEDEKRREAIEEIERCSRVMTESISTFSRHPRSYKPKPWGWRENDEPA